MVSSLKKISVFNSRNPFTGTGAYGFDRCRNGFPFNMLEDRFLQGAMSHDGMPKNFKKKFYLKFVIYAG